MKNVIQVRFFVLLATVLVSCKGNHSDSNHVQKTENNTPQLCCTTISEALKNAGSVEYLIINNRESYKTIPVDILKLKRLKWIVIKDQPDLDWDDFFLKISHLKTLESLEVNIVNCDTLSKKIALLTNLKHLSIGGKRLKSLPSNINDLVNLTELSVQSTLITEFPDLHNLKLLETLDLSDNHIHEIDCRIFYLKNLKELLLYQNNIEELPDCAGYAKQDSIVSVSIYDNPLSEKQLIKCAQRDKNPCKVLKGKIEFDFTHPQYGI